MVAPAENLRIDGARLWASIHEMAKIGPGVAGGSNRQALTPEDGEARALLVRWCEAAGLTLGVDRLGTMFARREGTDPGLDPVCVGSHLDTQPTGGRYDGVLGVLAALEILRTLDDLEVATRRPIVLVNWTNEEGSRFAPPMLASGVFAGVHDQAWAEDRRDAAGVRFGDALDRLGWRGDEPVGARRMHAFFELHIEQGPVLEEEGVDIGVVTHGQGLSWIEVTLTGRESHTGTTPMGARRDAALAMARVIDRVERIALDHGPEAVGSVGRVEVAPNSRNVIPGRARFTVDFRAPRAETIAAMERALRAEAGAICEAMGVEAAFAPLDGFDPVAFDPGCVDMVRRAAGRLGHAHRDLVSGAGHDACWIARAVPAAMVVCPCRGGLSHNEAEEITPDWARKGAEVLCHAVLEAAERRA